MFCTDLDLLRWESALPAEAAAASQTLFSVPATLEGARLTLDPAQTLNGKPIRVGHLVVLTPRGSDDALHGCYAITSIDSTGRRCELLRVVTLLDPPKARLASGTLAVEATFRTFAAQRLIVGGMLQWMRGIDPRDPVPPLASAELLRKPCVLGTLHLIYAGLAAASPRANADLFVRAELYHRLFREAIEEAGDLDRGVHADAGKCQPTPFTRRRRCFST